MVNTIAASEPTKDLVENKDGLAKYAQDIQDVTTDKVFSEDQKKDAIIGLMAQSVGIPKGFFEKSFPGAEGLYTSAQDIYQQIQMYVGMNDENKLKSAITYYLHQLKANQYVSGINGGGETSDPVIESGPVREKGDLVVDADKGIVSSKEDDLATALKKAQDELAENKNKHADTEKALQEKQDFLKEYEGSIAILSLISHPTKIPHYLRQRVRDKWLASKEKDPYILLYGMARGRLRRRFVFEKNRVRNAVKVCNEQIQKYENIAADKNSIAADKIEANRRLDVLRLLKPHFKELEKINVKDTLFTKK